MTHLLFLVVCLFVGVGCVWLVFVCLYKINCYIKLQVTIVTQNQLFHKVTIVTQNQLLRMVCMTGEYNIVYLPSLAYHCMTNSF